ncbi:MAG: hypothetical protein KBT00_04355 [Bacteroidales bacterium]|nr:hypothetical protein [Candidatus Cacconaster merdequi]
MKKKYGPMVFEPISIPLSSNILSGSPSTTNIKVNTVEVKEFEAGFDIGPEHNDFQDLSFD